MTDPRFNAPPRISDLPLDERRRACVDRYTAGTARFMEQYRNPPKPGLIERLFRGER